MFRNREDAARRLAERLRWRNLIAPVVLAIPRGGVVLGAVLAETLGADLDVVLSRKLRAPGQSEFALGAVSEDGQVYINPYAEGLLDAQGDYLLQEREFQLREIARRRALFREVLPRTPVKGRSVIVTDDGIATGSTMVAALRTLRLQKPHEVIVAVPVAAPDRLDEVRALCDEVLCLLAPKQFGSIGEFYEDFNQVEDGRVVELLRRFAPGRRAG